MTVDLEFYKYELRKNNLRNEESQKQIEEVEIKDQKIEDVEGKETKIFKKLNLLAVFLLNIESVGLIYMAFIAVSQSIKVYGTPLPGLIFGIICFIFVVFNTTIQIIHLHIKDLSPPHAKIWRGDFIDNIK